MGAEEICGLPRFVILHEPYRVPGGAMCAGDDFSVISVDSTYQWLMELTMFHTPVPVQGLLMWSRQRQFMPIAGSKFPPPQPPPELYFFGYKCQRCGQIYLLPDSVKVPDEIPAAMQHECSGDKHGR
jgi:hypothetical protein